MHGLSVVCHLHLLSRLKPALYSPSGHGNATPRLLTYEPGGATAAAAAAHMQPPPVRLISEARYHYLVEESAGSISV